MLWVIFLLPKYLHLILPSHLSTKLESPKGTADLNSPNSSFSFSIAIILLLFTLDFKMHIKNHWGRHDIGAEDLSVVTELPE